ncbi:MAG: TVP38/TMEM64 family protein [Trueperaceae bacterium]|nr:TVP38/TMEM64 family protein [Trueperaceae bacterium]
MSANAAETTTTVRSLRLIAIAAWALAVVAYVVVVTRSGASPLDVLAALLAFLQDHPLGAIAFVIAYMLRPLLLFSASLLTIGAGLLYGPLLGFAVVVVGANTGALLAYALARALGGDLARTALANPRLAGMAERLRAHTFETVLTLRFVFAPYDAVNYLAGALGLRVVPFVLATVIGSLPGTLVFLLFGAGLADLTALDEGGLPSVDPRSLLASAGILVLSLALARWWRRREARRIDAAPPSEDTRDQARD